MFSAPRDDRDRKTHYDAWGAFGLVSSGILVWGGLGLLLARLTGVEVIAMAGLLVGMGAGLYLVWFRYGRPFTAAAGLDDAIRRVDATRRPSAHRAPTPGGRP